MSSFVATDLETFDSSDEWVHPSHCDCEPCMIANEATLELHTEDCRCFWCEQGYRRGLNLSPSSIGLTDEKLLENWRNGEPIRPGGVGPGRVPKSHRRTLYWPATDAPLPTNQKSQPVAAGQ